MSTKTDEIEGWIRSVHTLSVRARMKLRAFLYANQDVRCLGVRAWSETILSIDLERVHDGETSTFSVRIPVG